MQLEVETRMSVLARALRRGDVDVLDRPGADQYRGQAHVHDIGRPTILVWFWDPPESSDIRCNGRCEIGGVVAGQLSWVSIDRDI
jgi:hypothetical protein